MNRHYTSSQALPHCSMKQFVYTIQIFGSVYTKLSVSILSYSQVKNSLCDDAI